ncbi:MAG: T9SS type A sorting domain-containing protein [Ignavibacteriales bacterium]|nr:T9SS type A sorting domain-containing protein [Ignavibacteriales bacterium]
MKTLVNELQQVGTYEVQFDASGIASGIYLYRIESGNFVQVKKMILLK